MRRLVGALALACLVCFGGAAVVEAALAQDEQPSEIDPAEERSAAFRAVEGPVTEDVPGGPLVVGAYATVWMLILLYVFRIGRMQGRLARDVDRLERSLVSSEGRAGGGEKG